MKKRYAYFVALTLVATLMTGCFRGRLVTRRTATEQTQTVEQKHESKVQPTRSIRNSSRLDIPAPLIHRAERILVRKGYTASYNEEMRIPNWVAWELTREHATGTVKRPNRAFHEDTDVSTPRATYGDYRDCGWSKGHMCPAGDNKWDRDAMYDTFLLTNICPQDYTLNSGYWNSVEMRCRHWAERFGSVTIVCGPILQGDHHQTIGDNHIVVPEAFFKVVVCLEGEPRGVGFICPNTDEHLSDDVCVTSINEVERVTGITFFPHLSPTVAEKVKSGTTVLR